MEKYKRLLKLAEIEESLRGVLPSFNWLQEGRLIKRIFTYSVDDFIDINIDILLDWHPIRFLGSGANGDAWLLDDGTVLKIF